MHASRPFLMVGLPASGKTTRARELETEHQAVRLSPDEWMIPLFGESNPGGKRDVLEGRLVWLAHRALQTQTNVVLDFGLWSRDERTALRSLARVAGAESKVVYLPIDAATQKLRVDERFASTPEQTFRMTESMLDDYRTLFESPGSDELDGSSLDPPPTGHGSWAEWSAQRWPSLPVL